MTSRFSPAIVALLSITSVAATAAAQGTATYLGQPVPGSEPARFAPGVVSTGLYERDVAVTPDGKEVYFTVVGGQYRFASIIAVREEAGRWTGPEVVPFSGDSTVMDIEPFVSPDGRRLYFASNRPRPGHPDHDRNIDLWYVERSGKGWGQPVNLGPPINTDGEECFPSLTRDGTLYFTRNGKGGAPDTVLRSRLAEGRYGQPELLPAQVNAGRTRFNAFVAPDESFLILAVVGLPGAIGPSDYHVVFRSADDRWSEPVNLGRPVNLPETQGWAASLSPDGHFLFFMSNRVRTDLTGRLDYGRLRTLGGEAGNGQPDIWWVDASFIQALKK